MTSIDDRHASATPHSRTSTANVSMLMRTAAVTALASTSASGLANAAFPDSSTSSHISSGHVAGRRLSRAAASSLSVVRSRSGCHGKSVKAMCTLRSAGHSATTSLLS